MKLRLVGTGDAYARDRANSAILLRDQGFSLLIDCGPTVCHQLWQNEDWRDIDAVYFTHLHPDHALGLTSLINRFNSSGRRRALTIYCHRGKEQRLQQLVEYGFWSDEIGYAVEFVLLDDDEGAGTFEIGPFTCRSAQTRHAVANHSLRLNSGGGALFYSGDGCITERSVVLIEGCELALIECQALLLPESAGHSDFAKAQMLAQRCPQTQVMLYHIGDRDLAAVAEAAAGHPRISLAEQGADLTL